MLLLLQNVRKGDGKNCREEDGGLKESPENIDEEILNHTVQMKVAVIVSRVLAYNCVEGD